MSKVTEIHKSLVPEIERSHILQDHMREIQKTLREVEKGCSLTTEQNFFLSIEDRTPLSEVTFYLENIHMILAIQEIDIGQILFEEQRQRERDFQTSVHILRQQS
jgi:hypothetical protein